MFQFSSFLDGLFSEDGKTEIGIGGFYTFARISDVTARSAILPTATLENGSLVTDHIHNDPIEISITGNVSDIYTEPNRAITALNDQLSKLALITQYLPARTQAQISLINIIIADLVAAISVADSLIQTGTQVGQMVGLVDEAEEEQGNIEKFISTMNAYMSSKATLSVEMPFQTHENMAIKSFVTRSNNRDGSQEFTITLKQLSFADVEFVEVVEVGAPMSAPKPAPNTGGQTAGVVDKGAQAGAVPEKSFLSYLTGLI